MKLKYIRCKHEIFIVGQEYPTFTGHDHGIPSISAAKRESRRLQEGALGQGLLRVVSEYRRN